MFFIKNFNIGDYMKNIPQKIYKNSFPLPIDNNSKNIKRYSEKILISIDVQNLYKKEP